MRNWLMAPALGSVSATGMANIDSIYVTHEVSFTCVASTDCTIPLDKQLSMQITGDALNIDLEVYFQFFNKAGAQPSITQIAVDGWPDFAFFDQPPNSGGQVGTGPGVQFVYEVTDLPAGKAVDFESEFAAHAVLQGAGGTGQIANGINHNGESLELFLGNQRHGNWLAFLHAINERAVRVGLHVTGLADGGSATYISSRADIPFPEPTIYAMLALGLLGCAVVSKGKRCGWH